MSKSYSPYDAIVFGEGVAGLGVACAFARRKKKVLVINKKGLSGQASSLAGGILDPAFEMLEHHPLLPVAKAAFRLFPRFARKLRRSTREDICYEKTGMLYVALTKPEEDELKKRFLWQKKKGIDVVWKTGDAVLKSEKLVNPQVRAGLFYPAVARVRAKPFMKAFKKYAVHLGVSFRVSETDSQMMVHADKIAGVQMGPETFETPAVVNATGAWSGINSFFPYTPPVRPARGQIVIVRAPSLKISTILHSLDGGYLVPWGGGHYLLGSTLEFVGFKPYNTDKGLEQIRFKIQKLVPAFNSYKILESWAGLRPCAEDYLPLIGPCKIRGLYAANGYYRSGILIGHYAGELLVQAILSGKFPRALEPFSPNRFLSRK